MKELVIFGTKEIAKAAFHYFSRDSDYRVVAFAVDSDYVESDSLCGLPIVPTDTLYNSFPPENTWIFVGISYGKMNHNRASAYERFRKKGYRFASYIDPKASIIKCSIGENVLILGNVSIQNSVTVGNNVIIGPNVAVCHGTHIKDHNYIASGVCFCGENVVEEFCVIGTSATIGPGVHIGKRNFIGIGANIFSSTEENEAYLTGATPKSRMPADSAWAIGLFK